jgi:hypothetical protein
MTVARDDKARQSLTTRQRRAVAALLAAPTLTEASVLAGVHVRTLQRYLQDAAFRAELHRAQDEAMAQATRQSLAAMTEALQTLQAIMADPTAQPSARVSAAKSILEHAARLYEATTLAERLAALESKVEAERG